MLEIVGTALSNTVQDGRLHHKTGRIAMAITPDNLVVKLGQLKTFKPKLAQNNKSGACYI